MTDDTERLSSDDRDLTPNLTDQQAKRFWRLLEAERKEGILEFDTAENAWAAYRELGEDGVSRRRKRRSAQRK